jgi:NitT/TauT family transport system substrate-binding protein
MMLKAFTTLAALLLTVSTAAAETLDKVAIAGWSQPISEIANLLAEPDKGFFKAEGIDLGYVPGAGGGSAIVNMLSGAAEVAFSDPASLYQALDQGEDLVTIYNIYPQNVFNVVAPVGRGIAKPEDLKGNQGDRPPELRAGHPGPGRRHGGDRHRPLCRQAEGPRRGQRHRSQG